MYKKIAAVLLATSLFSMPAYAHIMNADSMYTDIEMSDDRQAIIYTHALHLITTDSTLYKPNDLLTKEDFALWYSKSQKMTGEDAQLVEKAMQEGIISSEEGEVTYGEINEALFAGEIKVEDASAEVTRGDYADFVAKNASTALGNQQSLLQQLDFEEGPIGEVEKVEKVNNEEYEITIEGEPFYLAEHPSIMNDSTDPLVWQGQYVTESLVTKNTTADREGQGSQSDVAKLQFVSIETAPKAQPVEEKTAEPVQAETVEEVENETPKKEVFEKEESSFNGVLIAVAVAVFAAILGVIVYRKIKK